MQFLEIKKSILNSLCMQQLRMCGSQTNTWMPLTCMPKTEASVLETDLNAAHTQVL